MIESLEEGVERLKRENAVLNEKRKESRKKVATLEVIVHSMFLMKNEFDSESLSKNTQKSHADLMGKQQALESTIASLEVILSTLSIQCLSL